MKTNGASTQSLSDLLRAILPILAALIALLSSGYLILFDHKLFELIGFSRQAEFKTAIWQLIPTAVLVAYLSGEAALRVNKKYLPVVFFQTGAVAVFLSWLTWQWCGSFSLSTALIASYLSFALGLLTRSLKKTEEKQTSRYFELAIKNNELNQTRLALLKQDEADRRILASDLHDQVLNEIKSIKSQLQLFARANTEFGTKLKTLEQSLDTVVVRIRDVMESLFPSVLENLGLCPALDQLTRDMASRGHLQGRFIKTIDDLQVTLLNKTEQLLLFRLTQEALNNVVKHSQAKTIKITLEESDSDIILSIVDDGIGFQEKERGDSRGLRYMRLRADLIGARIAWQAGPAMTGTKVKIELPKVKTQEAEKK